MREQTFSHYRIVKKLGAGGMGEVYLAEDTTLKRRVALKFLSVEYTQNEERLRRFKQEARAASALNHPNILTIHEVGEAQGHHFIATEFIDGETLRQRLKRPGKMQASEMLAVAVQIASALAAAHEAGVVHRDIKPENIMLRRDGYVKVLDFGLAKLMEKATSQIVDQDAPTRPLMHTEAGAVMGTVPYMSPEQARGEVLDARTDVFSFGVVLYEMLSGRQPFTRASAAETMAAILTHEPAPLALSAPAPPELQHIIEKCLAKDKERRYQTMREVMMDLRGLEHRATAARAQVSTAPTLTNAKPFMASYRNRRVVLAAVSLLLLAAIGFGVYRRYAIESAPPIDSIAVLPLENLSGDPTQDYFADGMTDALITELSKIRTLRVISRSSMMQYKGTHKTIPEIARELNVSGVVEGSVLRSGERVRISAELFRATTGQNLWAESYERDLRDVLSLQSEVASGIVNEIKVNLTPQERAGLARERPINPEAQDAYLRGLYYFNRAINASREEEIKELFFKSFDAYEQAIKIEPNYAQAFAKLAQSYHWLASAGYPEFYPKAKEAALTAVRLDDQNVVAHAALGWIYWAFDWDFTGAEREFKRAIELDPSSYHANGKFLSSIGHHEEAIKAYKLAQELDPLNLPLKEAMAIVYYNARQFDLAAEQARRIVELAPDNPSGHFQLSQDYVYQNMFQEALAEGKKAIELSGGNSQTDPYLAWIYAKAGQRDEAIKILEAYNKLPERDKKSPKSDTANAMPLVQAYVALGDKDQAFFWLEKEYQARSISLFLKVAPEYDDLHDDPRFQDLLRRIGFPQ